MSLGPLMVDIAGTELSAEDIRVLSHPLVGSVILFTRNYLDVAQVTRLTAAIRAVRTPHLLIAVDHEGGRIQRFREGFTRLPSARSLGRRYDEDRREGLTTAQAAGWLMAIELRAVGVDFSFAPCVDLDYGVSEIIGDRSFHRDPDAVGALAAAYMAGMREAGMADDEQNSHAILHRELSLKARFWIVMDQRVQHLLVGADAHLDDIPRHYGMDFDEPRHFVHCRMGQRTRRVRFDRHPRR